MTEVCSSPENSVADPLCTLDEACVWLRENDNYLILCHGHPDGDTLGCGMALREMLRLIGKTAYCICESPVPHRLSFLTDERELMLIEQLPQGFLWDKVISVDVATPSLLGAYSIPFGENGFVDLAIDHHGTNALFAKKTLLNGSLSACAELIFDLGVCMFHWSRDNPPPERIAMMLYTGILTDSGSFRFSSVTPETHLRVSVLLASGMEHARLCQRLYSSRPMGEVMAAKAAYADLRFFFDGKVSLVTFTQETMEQYHLRDSDVEDVVNMIRGIEGVEVAVHLKYRDGNQFKISLRCIDGLNVAEVASRFGGGGHVCAAGCSISTGRDEAEATILSAIGEMLNKYDTDGNR